MFHRIKSEPQDAVQTEETPVQTKQETSKTEYSTKAEASNTETTNADDNKSPVQKYAEQQASLKSEKSDEAEKAQEQSTTTETSNKPQQVEETETMSTQTETTAEKTEEQTQEEAYRAPGSVTGGYPGSYGTSSYTAPTAPAAKPAATTTTEVTSAPTTASSIEDGGRLVIGSGITMSGEIESCPHLVVEGTVEASLRGAEILEVSQGGIFFGTVEIAEATISGRFEGDITVTGRLTVTESGQVTGSITYGELQMEAGASIDGKLTPMASRATSAKSPKATRETSAPKTRSEVSNDAQLFSNEAVVAAE